MDAIEKFLALRNYEPKRLFQELLILTFAGIVLFYAFGLVLSKWGNSLAKFPEGLLVVFWLFALIVFTLIFRSLFDFFFKGAKALFFREFNFAPPINLDDLIFQGWLEERNKMIRITNSGSGFLFKKLWLKNFTVEFEFNFEKLETSAVQGIFNEDQGVQIKLHRFNYLGFLFRAQSLEDYFMIAMAINVNIDDYNRKRNKNVFPLTVTPHIRVGGKWEIFGGQQIGRGVNALVNGFNKVRMTVKDAKFLLEINNERFEWNLPTNFSNELTGDTPQETAKVNLPGDKNVSRISFRTNYGMIGFRAWKAEHALIKNILVKKV